MIRDHLDHGRSNEVTNPCPEWIHRTIPKEHTQRFFDWRQHERKVMSDNPELVDFAIGLVIFVLNLTDGQVLFLGKFKLKKDCNQSC